MKNLTEGIELLCGQSVFPADYIKQMGSSFPTSGLGWRQLNELILAHQLDRMGRDLFMFIFECDPVPNFEEFERCVTKFRTHGAVKYGNFKYAYKHLRQKTLSEILVELDIELNDLTPGFQSRLSPLVDLQVIEPKDTFLLGYLIEKELQSKRSDVNFIRHYEDVRARGKVNHDIYLDFDYMDVYVATSMRERLDFWNVSRFVSELQNNDVVNSLNLRFFDPTQAYCRDRIDKGLVEGLMLKRAACTIYLVGESETLGKDSELAATLAQGKTVIAYVPAFDSFEKFRADYVDLALSELYADTPRIDVALKFLQVYWPDGAWKCGRVRDWCESGTDESFDDIVREIYDRARDLYDTRANTLKRFHPLGLQVHLESGVANGVLVARSVGECAELLRRIMLKRLEFRLEKIDNVIAAVETTTSSIHRVVSGDSHLTNSFWNFYFER